MDIIEAIKSGKKYRRIGEKHWYETAPDFSHYAFSTRDVLSDDWEIEQTSVTITRQQFDDAWVKSINDALRVQTHPATLPYLRDLVAKEIGL